MNASQTHGPTRKKEPPPSATSLMSGVDVHCCYCNRPHAPSDCDVVTQVEVRRQILRRGGRCYNCLRRGHLNRDCRSRTRCSTCRGRHHLSICGRRSETSPPPKTTPSSSRTDGPSLNPEAQPFTGVTLSSTSAELSDTSTLYADSSGMVLLQTAITEVSNPRDSSCTQKVGIVLDGGSQRSYITQRVKDSLQLPVQFKKSISIAAFGLRIGRPKQCEVVQLAVKTKRHGYQHLEVLVVPHICEPVRTQATSVYAKMHEHLSQLDLADVNKDETLRVDLLIGSDYYWEFVTGNTVRGDDGPVAIETTLGWVLSGPTGVSDPTLSLNVHILHVGEVTNAELDRDLRLFWELESLGIGETMIDPASNLFASSLQVQNGRYEVSLPWRDYHEDLPDNYNLSRRRLHGLLRRLRQDPEVLREYDLIIRDQLAKGIVKRVDESTAAPKATHYLSHHAVIRRDKETTKVRVVYDASARSGGPSLNDCLYTGPKFNQRILELLLRFRSYPVAFIADIEKAFLMISINPKDRDVLRFLWVKDPFSNNPEVVVLRFTRVVFGVSASPFLLNATIDHHLDEYKASHPEVVQLLKQSIYVDDVVCGGDSESEAFSMYMHSKEMLSHACFNLRKFVTNAASLQALVNNQEAPRDGLQRTGLETSIVEADEKYLDATLHTSTTKHPTEQRVLGVRWDVSRDQLLFCLDVVVEGATSILPTKRTVISLIGRVYDPLGFLSPITVRLKMLMQELCRDKMGWDQPLAGETLRKWKRLVEELRMAPTIALPRCCLQTPKNEDRAYRLNGFCDASNAAYAAVVYLVEQDSDHTYTHLIISKT